MLARNFRRLLCEESPEKTSRRCGILWENVRKYYDDPQAIKALSQHLYERRLLIKKRESAEIAIRNEMKKRRRQRWDFFSMGPPAQYQLFFTNSDQWREMKLKEHRIKDQAFTMDRHDRLGYDLGAAHFVLYRGGKVRFKGQSDWMMPVKFGKINIPNSYDPSYLIEALDLSETLIEYEGLLNICSLLYLKWLSFQGSPTINDWSLDRISAEYPNLEYLDISKCKNVTERGLESLYRMPSLKTLIVTNHYNSPAFELTCYMLEDVNPNLKCDIRDPQNNSLTEETKT